MQAKDPIIEITNLTKCYNGKHAVNDLNLTIYRGEVFGLLGPNGAGKSTTILMLLGLTEPSSGTVSVCGFNSTRDPIKVKQKVGYLPDNVGFYEERTGLENLLYTASLNGLQHEDAEKRALQLLTQVGLDKAIHKKAGKYSRGMKQRLGLADVLIKNPEVIILDEPTLGIDPKGVQDLLSLIRTMSKEYGITVLLSSHHLHQVQQICDRVGIFVDGKLLANGNIKELAYKLFAEEHKTIVVKVAHINEALVKKIQDINGVVSVDIAEQHELHIKSKTDITAKIGEIVIKTGLSLHRLVLKEHGLDDIYHQYFEGVVNNEGKS